MIFQKRFNLKQTYDLLMDGWEVDGDRLWAWRNGERIDPTIYRERQAKNFELLTKQQPPKKP